MRAMAERLEQSVARVFASVAPRFANGGVTVELLCNFHIGVSALAKHRLHLGLVRFPGHDPQVGLAKVLVEDLVTIVGHEDLANVRQVQAGHVVQLVVVLLVVQFVLARLIPLRHVLQVGAGAERIFARREAERLSAADVIAGAHPVVNVQGSHDEVLEERPAAAVLGDRLEKGAQDRLALADQLERFLAACQ